MFFSIPRLESFEPRRVNILYQISKESHMVTGQSYCSVGLMHIFALHEPFIIYQTHSFQLTYPCTKPVFSLSLFLFYREANWSHKCFINLLNLHQLQLSSVAQSCLTLCDLTDCSTPGFPVHHQLPEFTQTHVHLIFDAIQLSHPLLYSSPPAFSLSQHQGLF